MPTPAKKTTTKKAAPKRSPRTARTTPTPPSAESEIAVKRRKVMGEDAPAGDPYAPSVWGSETAQGRLVDLDLPSGQRCLAQRPGPEGLMAAGMLDDLDMLATVLPKAMGGKKASAKDFDASQLMKNPTMLRQAMKLMDRVLVYVVVKPQLENEPDDPRDREIGKIYPSSVSMEDKSFIFNWAVGGTRDLRSFRERYEESVANLDTSEDVENTSE